MDHHGRRQRRARSTGSRETGSGGNAVSSDSTVVRVGERTTPDGIGGFAVVEGVAPGTATITWTYYWPGVSVVPLQIRVQ